MELRATAIGRQLAQHPYDRVEILTAGVQLSGENHYFLIPFNQLLAMHCKRGLVWGELEFVLADNQVVRLHGTQWQQTQHFWQHLQTRWQQWSQQMSGVAADVLQTQLAAMAQLAQKNRWISWRDISTLRQSMHHAFNALPLPLPRLTEFACCRLPWQHCQQWLQQTDSWRSAHNQAWSERLWRQHQGFFSVFASTPLSAAQCRAVVNAEDSLLILGGPGSGKSTVLLARAGWLLMQQALTEQQLLLLSASPQSAQALNLAISQLLPDSQLSAHSFPALAVQIIQQAGGKDKIPYISELEYDVAARYVLLIDCWQQQCREKKSHANGWRQWLTGLLGIELSSDKFWQDQQLAHQLAPRLDHWLTLLRLHGGKQKQQMDNLSDQLRPQANKQLTLLTPLLKAWKTALKSEGATDSFSLLSQAGAVLTNGRFISPWKYILLDDFHQLSAAQTTLLSAFRQQNSHTRLSATADDGQAISRLVAQQPELVSRFDQQFGSADHCVLDTSYRLNSQLCNIASGFLLVNPQQTVRPLHCLSNGNKKSVMLLPQQQLSALLDKISGYARPDQRILLLARYAHQRPSLLDSAATRWPALALEFLTIDASQGQQADYVIVCGLDDQADGLPGRDYDGDVFAAYSSGAGKTEDKQVTGVICSDHNSSVVSVANSSIVSAASSALSQALAPETDPFPYAQPRRLLYVALTRACISCWLLFNPQHPSSFVSELKQLGAYQGKKP